MLENIIALQDLPSLNAFGLDVIEDNDGGATCTACTHTCSKTLSE